MNAPTGVDMNGVLHYARAALEAGKPKAAALFLDALKDMMQVEVYERPKPAPRIETVHLGCGHPNKFTEHQLDERHRDSLATYTCTHCLRQSVLVNFSRSGGRAEPTTTYEFKLVQFMGDVPPTIECSAKALNALRSVYFAGQNLMLEKTGDSPISPEFTRAYHALNKALYKASTSGVI